MCIAIKCAVSNLGELCCELLSPIIDLLLKTYFTNPDPSLLELAKQVNSLLDDYTQTRGSKKRYFSRAASHIIWKQFGIRGTDEQYVAKNMRTNADYIR